MKKIFWVGLMVAMVLAGSIDTASPASEVVILLEMGDSYEGVRYCGMTNESLILLLRGEFYVFIPPTETPSGKIYQWAFNHRQWLGKIDAYNYLTLRVTQH